MISHRKFWIIGVFGIAAASLVLSCATQTPSIKPATVMQRDVFVCKGLSEDNNWVGVTDQFLPDKDSQVVVVAFLDKKDIENVIHVELVNPVENIATSESVIHPKDKSIGVYFSIPKLLQLGSEGEWKAIVYSDGEAIGESKFYIGEKPTDKEEEEGPRYYVVGSEGEEESGDQNAQDLSEEDRFSSYIREASPNLTIPLPPETKPADNPISPATP